MYAMCDRFGIPGIFFTLTPDDLNTFQVRLWVNSGKPLSMLSLDCSDEDCVQDFLLRRDARIRYPGACSLEYQSVVQIALKVLFGWDSDKRQGSEGVFGELIAYAIGHEEQGKPFELLFGIYKCH